MDKFNRNYENQLPIINSQDTKEFKIKNKIRLIELFGGIGSQAMTLRNIGADFEHYRLVEYDKYPVASYNAIFDTDFEPMDITKINADDLGIVDTDKYTYLLTYSFPCQDLSVAGKQKGMTKGSNTRSGLLWEVERLLNEIENLPQILLMENVPMLHSKKNMPDFQKWIDFLKSKGYSNYWKDLNAKNFGVAQNRNRCFMVSLLGEYKYNFPESIELTKVIKDYLENDVESKYYLTSEKAKLLIDKLILEGKILTDRQTDRQSTCQLTSQTSLNQQTVLKQDMMQESAILSQMEPVLLSGQGTVFEKKIDLATTLLARDYKGFGNQEMNGVIECKKLK